MSFHDVSIPDGYQYGSQSGAGFRTVIQETASGHEQRLGRQAAPRHRFRLIKAMQSDAEAGALKAFVFARRGALHTFRLKDWSDYTSAEDGVGATSNLDCLLGSADGTTQSFQLVKSYAESDPGELPRVITLPVDGTVSVAVAGVAQTLGVDYTVTNPGGIITFGTAPPSGAVTAGFEFDVPARFELSTDEWNRIQADAFQVWSLNQMEAVEVLNEVEYPELWYPGGSTVWGAQAIDLTLSLAQGKLHTVSPSTAINVFLPTPPTGFPGGSDVFVVHNNTGSAGTLQLRDDTGATVGSTIAAGVTRNVAATVDNGSVTWVTY